MPVASVYRAAARPGVTVPWGPVSLPLCCARKQTLHSLASAAAEPPGVRCSNRTAVVRPLRSALHPRAPRDTDLGFRKATRVGLAPTLGAAAEGPRGRGSWPGRVVSVAANEPVRDGRGLSRFCELQNGTVPFSETVHGSAQADARGLVDPRLIAQRPSLPRCTTHLGSRVAPLLVRALRLRVRPAYHRKRSRLSARPGKWDRFARHRSPLAHRRCTTPPCPLRPEFAAAGKARSPRLGASAPSSAGHRRPKN